MVLLTAIPKNQAAIAREAFELPVKKVNRFNDGDSSSARSYIVPTLIEAISRPCDKEMDARLRVTPTKTYLTKHFISLPFTTYTRTMRSSRWSCIRIIHDIACCDECPVKSD